MKGRNEGISKDKFDVLELMDVRGRGHHTEYLVRLKAGSSENRTAWKPVKELNKYKEMMHEFMKKRNYSKIKANLEKSRKIGFAGFCYKNESFKSRIEQINKFEKENVFFESSSSRSRDEDEEDNCDKIQGQVGLDPDFYMPEEIDITNKSDKEKNHKKEGSKKMSSTVWEDVDEKSERAENIIVKSELVLGKKVNGQPLGVKIGGCFLRNEELYFRVSNSRDFTETAVSYDELSETEPRSLLSYLKEFISDGKDNAKI